MSIGFPGICFKLLHFLPKVEFQKTDQYGKSRAYQYYVHLDNVNEIAEYGEHTFKNEPSQTLLGLKTKRAHRNAPNSVKRACSKQIIEKVFGETDVLSILIENASTLQLKQIHEIIKQKRATYHKKMESKKKDEDEESIQEISSLSQISRDSITNIIGFLDRSGISSFKLTSFRNGMLCLREMAKINIGVSNVNEILNDMDKKYVDKLGPIADLNRQNYRYPANVTISSFSDSLMDKYNIPSSKQLLVSATRILEPDLIPDASVKQMKAFKYLLFVCEIRIKFLPPDNIPQIVGKKFQQDAVDVLFVAGTLFY